MEYRALGKSGLKVSELCLGNSERTVASRADEDTSLKIINYALESGINFIDTSDAGNGRPEELIGKALKGKRSQAVIATKFGGHATASGGSRNNILKSVEGSLKRLDTDYIDLYYFHRPDPATPIEETLRVLDDLVRAGKVRYIGCSNFAAWQLCEAMWTSKTRNLEPFVAVQSRYNLIDRSIERELVPCCQKYDVGIVPWQSLAAGFLTAKYQSGQQMPPGVRLRDARPQDSYILTEANYSKLARLEAFARERDHSVNELAIAWLLSHPWLISVVAGARTVEQLSLNVPAVNWRLTKEDVAQLDKIA